MMVCGRLFYGCLPHQGPGHRHDWHGAAGVGGLCGLYSVWCEMMVCGRLFYGCLYHQGPGHRHDWHGAAGVGAVWAVFHVV